MAASIRLRTWSHVVILLSLTLYSPPSPPVPATNAPRSGKSASAEFRHRLRVQCSYRSPALFRPERLAPPFGSSKHAAQGGRTSAPSGGVIGGYADQSADMHDPLSRFYGDGRGERDDIAGRHELLPMFQTSFSQPLLPRTAMSARTGFCLQKCGCAARDRRSCSPFARSVLESTVRRDAVGLVLHARSGPVLHPADCRATLCAEKLGDAR